MAEKARTASIAELARDGDGWSPLRMHLDVRAFGVNAWTASEAGAQLDRRARRGDVRATRSSI